MLSDWSVLTIVRSAHIRIMSVWNIIARMMGVRNVSYDFINIFYEFEKVILVYWAFKVFQHLYLHTCNYIEHLRCSNISICMHATILGIHGTILSIIGVPTSIFNNWSVLIRVRKTTSPKMVTFWHFRLEHLLIGNL